MRALIIVLTLAWGALSFWVLYGIQMGYPPPGAFVAKRDLVFGHRIVAGDVEAVPLLSWHRTLRPDIGHPRMSRDFVGRYVIQPGVIKKTGSIAFDATADRPDFSGPNTGHTLAWVALTDVKAAVAGDIDPGDLLDVCGDTPSACANNLTIAAITCAADGACSAAAWVTSTERDRLIAARSKSYSVYVHPAGVKP